jgi:hypothetical protein
MVALILSAAIILASRAEALPHRGASYFLANTSAKSAVMSCQERRSASAL